jgi:hypothetical protein
VQRAREADEKKWAAEEMLMYQEVLRQEDELKRVQAQIKKRELANAYAAQISLARQAKEDTPDSGSSIAKAADKWTADSRDEVASRAYDREQRDTAARRNRQTATNEALRQQVEDKRQRETARKAAEQEQAALFLHEASEGLRRDAEEANARRYQRQMFAYGLDEQRGLKSQEPQVYLDAFTAGQLGNKENSYGRGRVSGYQHAYISSPFTTEALAQVPRKPPMSRTSAPYAVYDDLALPSKLVAKPRISAPYALYDELETTTNYRTTDAEPQQLRGYHRAESVNIKRGRS